MPWGKAVGRVLRGKIRDSVLDIWRLASFASHNILRFVTERGLRSLGAVGTREGPGDVCKEDPGFTRPILLQKDFMTKLWVSLLHHCLDADGFLEVHKLS